MVRGNKIVDPSETIDEARAWEILQRLQEQGPAAHRQPKIARTYVHTVHPDTGLDVVFVPGEALPEWVDLDDKKDDDADDDDEDVEELP